MRESSKYFANFQRVGGAYDDTLTLLIELDRRRSWDAVRSAVFEENLLEKNSRHWMVDILRAVKRRYMTSHQLLPDGFQLSEFVAHDIARYSKIQVLYQYICDSDPLVDRAITELIAPSLRDLVNFKLTKPLFRKFFAEEARVHPELASWSDSVKGKWQRSFFAFLRSSGMMAKAPSVDVRKPVIRPEAFIFILYGMLDKGLSVGECVNSSLWKRYFLSSDEVEKLLSEGQMRGWLEYRRLGSIVELKTSYLSLEDWVNGALGQR